MKKDNSKQGFFITVEGIEGVGKSTALQFLEKYFREQKFDYIVTREPGGTPVAETIRQIILDNQDESICPETELMLFFAGRAQFDECSMLDGVAPFHLFHSRKEATRLLRIFREKPQPSDRSPPRVRAGRLRLFSLLLPKARGTEQASSDYSRPHGLCRREIRNSHRETASPLAGESEGFQNRRLAQAEPARRWRRSEDEPS